MADIGILRGLNMRSLRIKVLFLIIVVFFPAMGVSLYAGWEYRQREIARIQQDVLSLARLAAKDQEELIVRTTPPLLKLLAALYPEVHAQDGAKTSALFARLLSEYPQYINIMAARVPGGDVFASGISLDKPLNLTDRPYFSRILKTRDYVVGEFALGKATGKPTLVCGYPVLDPRGRVCSVIVAGIDVEYFARHAASSQPNRNVVVSLLDRNGRILSSTRDHDAWVGKDVSRTAVWRILRRTAGEGVFRGPGFDGKARVVAFRPLVGATGKGDGYVVASITEEEAVAAADRFMRHNLIVLGIGTLLALMGGLVIGHRYILRNVDALVRTTERLAEGDLHARAGALGKTEEFARLAHTFDVMAERLLQRETALFDEKERLMVTLRSIGDGVITTDSCGRVVLLNGMAERLTGWSQEDATGRPLEEVFHIINEVTRERCANPAEKVLRTGAIVELANHTALISRDGRELVIADSGAPISDRDGTVIGVVLVFRDITERRQAEQDIMRLNAELEQRVIERTAQLEMALQHAESFSYSISHDLRAPLRAVDGYANIVMEEYGPALPLPAQGYLQKISGNVCRMGCLIDALLTFSRFSLLPLTRQTVDPVALVREILADLQNNAAGRQVDARTADLPSCQADPVLLRQIFHNLLANAFKYTRQKPQACIEIGATFVDGRCVYYVKDNGVGFDMRYVNKLFGVFQRLHDANDFEGTGVGLAIARNIVHRHGGDIWAEGKVDAGATFYFTLEGQG